MARENVREHSMDQAEGVPEAEAAQRSASTQQDETPDTNAGERSAEQSMPADPAARRRSTS